MTPVMVAVLRGLSWTAWLVADAIDPPQLTVEQEFAALDGASAGPWSDGEAP